MIFPRIAILAGVCLALGAPTAIGPGGVELVGASSDSDVWFTAADHRESDGMRLYHHAIEMGGPFFRSPLALPSAPARMAAAGSQVWLVFERLGQRQVLTMRAHRDEATGLYFYDPPDSLTLVPSLPSHGALVGFVATERGPAALLVPPQWKEADVRAGEGATASEPTLEEPLLVELRGGDWVEVALPEFRPRHRPIALGTVGDGNRLAIIAEDTGTPGRAMVVEQTSSGAWQTRGSIRVDAEIALTRARGRVVVVYPRDRAWVGADLLRAGALIHLRAFKPSGSGFVVLGTRRALAIFEQDADRDLSIRTIDLVSGEVSAPLALRPQPLATAQRLVMPILLIALSIAILIILLMRPPAAGQVALPSHLAPGELGARAMALLVDLFPACVVVILATGRGLEELFVNPMWASNIAESMPLILTALLTAGHAAVAELIWGTSLGKRLFGLHIVTTDGRPPRPWQVIVRNLLKAVAVIVPPLAIVVLFSPTRQRLGDVAARTIVVKTVAAKGDDSHTP